MTYLHLFYHQLLKNNNMNLKKTKALVIALLVVGISFGQLNNCINTKEHPLVLEIMDSIKLNKGYNSILAFTVINGNEIGLSGRKVVNVAYAWAACKKIKDPILRKEEELKYVDAFFSNEELEKIVSCLKKYRGEKQ